MEDGQKETEREQREEGKTETNREISRRDKERSTDTKSLRLQE